MPGEKDTQVTFWLTEDEKQQYKKIAKEENNSGLSEYIRKSMRITAQNPKLLDDFALPEEDLKYSPELEKLRRILLKRSEREFQELEDIRQHINQLNKIVNWLAEQHATTKQKKEHLNLLKGKSNDLGVLGLE